MRDKIETELKKELKKLERLESSVDSTKTRVAELRAALKIFNELQGDSVKKKEEPASHTAAGKILKAMRRIERPVSRKGIEMWLAMDSIHLPRNTITGTMQRLRRQAYITNDGGMWSLCEDESTGSTVAQETKNQGPDTFFGPADDDDEDDDEIPF